MHVLLLPRPPLLRERDENFGLDWKKCSYNLSICLPFTDLFDGHFLFPEKVTLNLTWIELSAKSKPFFIYQFMWYVALIFQTQQLIISRSIDLSTEVAWKCTAARSHWKTRTRMELYLMRYWKVFTYTRQEKGAKVTLLKLISWKGLELVLTLWSCLVVVQNMELLKTR